MWYLELENLSKIDPELAEIIKKEIERQEYSIELIPSENFVNPALFEAMGSVLTNKYSEGYPKKRYYGGNQFVDLVEQLAIERAKKVFGVPYVNVQPYSGSPANFAVYVATCKPGDVIMGQNLPDGGHLTHGWKASVTGQYFTSIPYHVTPDGVIDLEEVRKLAVENKPKLIWVGSTAYVREFPFEEFAKIADEVGAYLVADIAHISGLVIAGVHKSPVPYAHIITTTTHKTLRGPRGAMIMVTEKGLKKDPELGEKIDRAVFPGLQGGPHDHTTAAIAAALGLAMKDDFKEYGKQIVQNAKALADSLMKRGMKLVGNGTENHMILIDLTPFGKGKGIFVQEALDLAGITLNKNTIPADPSSPFYPSGVRLGTPAITSRGMKEEEMYIIAGMIVKVIGEVKNYELSDDKEQRAEALKKFREEIENDQVIKEVRKDVVELCKRFPLYKK